MKLKLISLGLTLIGGLITLSGQAFALGPYSGGTIGTDLSWPNCNQRYSLNGVFGITGVTDGQVYSTNPCLSKEASKFINLSLYANTGWYSLSTHINPNSPLTCTIGDENCLAYNYGYNAGLAAYNTANSVGLRSSTWWLDVESSNSWSGSSSQNVSSIQGEHDALVSSGAVNNIGIYSTTAQWDSITGSWQNNWPSWGATTWKNVTGAKSYCSGHQFTAGPSWLMQYIGKVDQDYAC